MSVKAAQQLERMRKRQWMYLGPIVAAPLAHIAVTLYRDAKTKRNKQVLIGCVVGATVLSLGMRLFLMGHAGYPGKEAAYNDLSERVLVVNSVEERESIRRPKSADVAKEIARGFG